MANDGPDFREERSGRSLWRRIVDLSLTDVGVLMKGGVDEEVLERLERTLLEADFGVDAALELVEELERAWRRGDVRTESELRELLRARVMAILAEAGGPEAGIEPAEGAGPKVTLLLGVNGTGKTTTAARLAYRDLRSGRRPLLAATDTFRSGAQEQLRVWAERLGAEFVGGEQGGDPAAVAWEAARVAVERGCDHCIVDTAGRLHTRRGLVEELRKIDRVLGRQVEGAPHRRLLVVDATSGQNVRQQARQFGEALPLDGLVLAKFDSSARGGTAVAVAREIGLPVVWVGTGERPEDLEPFDPATYTEALFA